MMPPPHSPEAANTPSPKWAKLPKAKGRRWTECDVNTRGAKSRGEERIVFSNDGLIYYSPDHYESFELLYGQPS